MRDGSVRRLDVDVFALRVTREFDDWPERGQRERRWFTPQEAAAAVDEIELGDIVRRFEG